MDDRIIEKAQFFEVTGPIDHPVKRDEDMGIPVAFNPTTLKVTLANSLKENERSGTQAAAQYVDKSSSSLSVELIFDNTDIYSLLGVGADVRMETGIIAELFMHQEHVGDKHHAPKRCMFAWGTFQFVGIMESFDETLDYFSSEGAPLRATVAIKITESRYQFLSQPAQSAERETPTLSGASDSATEANANAGNDPKNWRDTSLYNGVESPRLPSASALSVPKLSAGGGAGFGVSGGAGFSGGIGGGMSGGIGISGGAGISGGVGAAMGGSFSAGVSGGFSAGVSGSAGLSSKSGFSASFSRSANITPTAFSFGSSSSLGTGIAGAFSAQTKSVGGFTAGSIVALQTQSAAVNGAGGTAGFSYSSGSGSGVKRASASVTLGPNGVKTSSVGFD